MSHTASRTWVSNETQERERFQRFMSNKHLIAPESPFVPVSWKDWVTHRLEMKEAGQRAMKTKINSKEAFKRRESKARVMPLMNGKVFNKNFGAVVAYETVFVPWYKSSEERVEPPWPSYEEFKHEGDDRERSKYKRQLPLPRKPGNATVNWKQRQVQLQYEFDQASDARSPESRKAMSDMPDMAHYIGRVLWDELKK